MDGAGDAGVFTPMESKQIAILIYDPIIEAITRYFGGDVNRFKRGIAVLIIMLGKGRVHFTAIRNKKKEQKLDDQNTNFVPDEVEPTQNSDDTMARLAKMQRENGVGEND